MNNHPGSTLVVSDDESVRQVLAEFARQEYRAGAVELGKDLISVLWSSG